MKVAQNWRISSVTWCEQVRLYTPMVHPNKSKSMYIFIIILCSFYKNCTRPISNDGCFLIFFPLHITWDTVMAQSRGTLCDTDGDRRYWRRGYTKEKGYSAVSLDCLCLIRAPLKDRSIELTDILYSQSHNRHEWITQWIGRERLCVYCLCMWTCLLNVCACGLVGWQSSWTVFNIS